MLQVIFINISLSYLLYPFAISQALIPQMRAVQAFKRSLKKPKDVKKVEEKKTGAQICSIPPPPQYKSDEGSEKSSSPEKKTRKHDDDITVEDECKFPKHKKSKTQETIIDNDGGSSNEDEELVKVAFQKTFGKLRKGEKSKFSKNK